MDNLYHLDLKKFQLAHLHRILRNGRLLPSEQMLGEIMDDCFATLRSIGITNLAELAERLKTSKRTAQLAAESGLPAECLTILRRRIGHYTPKPVVLSKFPGIEPSYIERLAAAGIKNSKHLFVAAGSKSDRAALAARTDVPEEILLELVKLSDLVRAAYVGPVYARLIYATGLDTLAKLAASSSEQLKADMARVNKEQGIMKAALPSEDLDPWLETVEMIPKAIEY